MFYVTPDLGIGKLISGDHCLAQVRLFHSIARQEVRGYPPAALKRIQLQQETRVYVDTGQGWRIGRVVDQYGQLDDGGYDYLVQFPNRQFQRCSERELEVRCRWPHPDPTEVLAKGGMETQFWHDRRQQLLDVLIRQRAASRGMSGLLSSRIGLVRHQVEVVRRVLEDPLQRYLLADEVGLGKTIEAGCILRQTLLAETEGIVRVLAPASLQAQWRRELKDKFGVGDDLPAAQVEVLTHGDPNAFAETDLALLVIDEAHHLVGNPTITPLLERLAARARRLLLLSATPVLGHEATLLGLLHLLDPATYDQDSLTTFTAKVSRREEYGHFLRGLRADAPPVLLRQRIRRAPELFAGDATALALTESLLQAIEDKDQTAITDTCQELRIHIAETYRIHQRLIRTRRVEVEQRDPWVFRPRGPAPTAGQPVSLAHVRVELDEDPRLTDLIDLLEQWRQASQLGLEPDDPEAAARAQRYRELFEALGCGAETFGATLRRLKPVGFRDEPALQAGFDEVMTRTAGPYDRYAVVAASLNHLRKHAATSQQQPKLVVFGSDPDDVKRLQERLHREWGERAVMALGVNRQIPDGWSVAEQFRNDPEAWVLLCDRRGEEGLNLHFVDALLQLDLPLAVGRIEQRIGRLDRFGRRHEVVKQRILLPSDDDFSPWLAWFEALAQGYQLFNRSVSDVQFQLETLEAELTRTLYWRGTAGLRAIIPAISERLRTERERLDNQYALDGVIQDAEAAFDFFEELEQVEEDEEAIGQAFKGWLIDGLQFHGEQRHQKRIFRLSWQWDQLHTLLPPVPWAEWFAPVINGEMPCYRYTWPRHKFRL